MKTKGMAVITVAVFCFMMMAAGAAWSGGPNGTITDPGTGLVWLLNANCFGPQKWNDAINSAKNLKSGYCGLTDGSTAGQWRLPTIRVTPGGSGLNSIQREFSLLRLD